MRWIWKPTAAAVCALLAIDLVIGYGWYQEHQAPRRTGFTARTYVDEQGERRGYVVFVPYELPDDGQRPLLMFLNGRGENGSDGVRQIRNNFGRPIWEMQQRFPFVCLAPQCSANGSWSPHSIDTKIALGVLDQVIDEYRIDPDRVYLTGVSAGGSGVFSIAAVYPERFAAVVPLAGAASGLDVERAADEYAQANLPIWSFYNNGDKEGLVAFNRTIHGELIERGLSPVFVEYDQEGHNCWEWAYRMPAMYDWLSRQDRARNAIRPKCQLLSVDATLSGWESDAEDRWWSEEGVLRVNKQPKTSSSSTLLCESSHENFELHFDYRSDEGQGFEVVLQSATDAANEVRVVIDWPESGSGGIEHSESSMRVTGTDPIAQMSLKRRFWNDIRLRRFGSQVSVRVNGLLLAESDDMRISDRCRFGLQAQASNQDGAWRYLRLQPLLGDVP